MGYPLLIGGILIAYSVPTTVFLLLICRRAQLVIVMLTSAFFYLVSLLVSSLLYWAIPPFGTTGSWLIVPLGTLIQEVARFIFVKFYANAERSFSVVSINAIVFPMIDLYSSIAAGVGWGAMHTFLYYAVLIQYSIGPGALFSPHCPHFSTNMLAAWLALLFNLLHIGLMVIAFDGFRSRSPLKFGLILLAHLAASCLTLVNVVDSGCLISVPAIAGVTLIVVIAAVITIHSTSYRSKKRS